MVAWRNATFNPVTGGLAADTIISNNRTDITVWAVDPSTGLALPTFGSWTFKGSWCKGLSDIPFDYSSGEPIICTATMEYLVIDDTIL